MKRICESCEEIIDERQTFQSDDEDVFETVMMRTSDEDICYECALTEAVIEQTMKGL